MTPDLAAAVEAAYGVFARYTIGDTLVVCHCNVCMTPDAERALTATPLRRITAALMAEYTNSAHGYDDGRIADELRYLLPRYLDLIAADDPPDHFGSLATCLSRLAYASWRDRWPAAEAEAISRVFDALIVDRVLHIEPRLSRKGWYLQRDIDDVLSLVATAGGDIGRLLARWDAVDDPPAALWMAEQRRNSLVQRRERPYFYNVFINGAEPEAIRDASYTIGAFLARPEVAARIEAAFFTVDHPGLQEILSQGLG